MLCFGRWVRLSLYKIKGCVRLYLPHTSSYFSFFFLNFLSLRKLFWLPAVSIKLFFIFLFLLFLVDKFYSSDFRLSLETSLFSGFYRYCREISLFWILIMLWDLLDFGFLLLPLGDYTLLVFSHIVDPPSFQRFHCVLVLSFQYLRKGLIYFLDIWLYRGSSFRSFTISALLC